MGTIEHNLPARLAEVRSLTNLSQSELSKRLGVSSSLISHWEKGTRVPSQAQLLDIARHMGVTLDYLLNARIKPKFQCRARTTSPQQAEIEQALLDAQSQVHFVDTAYRLAQKAPQPFMLRADFGSSDALPSIASHLRDTLKLNRRITLEELKQALSEWRIFVFDWDMPWHLSGLSFRGAFSVIFINHKHSPKRRLFTLAHEFAHVVFHLGRDNASEDRMDTLVSIASNREPVEKQANAFAGEFLMPRADLESLIAKYSERLREPSMLEAAARQFNVSRDAIFYRLTQLDFFRWSDKSAYFGGNFPLEEAPPQRIENLETIDSQVDPRFREVALELFQAGTISAGKLAEWFFAPRHLIEEYVDDLRNKKRLVITDESNHEEDPAEAEHGDADF